jgi:hypothetical protein
MSSVNLERLINEFPEEREAMGRLSFFLDRASCAGKNLSEITPQRMFDIVNPSSQRVLTKILVRLVDQGILEKSLRIESDSQGGIQDFKSISEIPAVIFDGRAGYEVEVRMDQIRLIYKIRLEEFV